MSSIKALSYTYRWEITQSIVLPTSIILTCYFQNRWVKDGHTNYPGIICATVINTAAYVWLNRKIRKRWVDYWEDKRNEAIKAKEREEATKESEKEISVRQNKKISADAQLALEKSHTAVRDNKFQLETATRDKKREFEESQAAHTHAKNAMQEARRIRDEFINKKLNPALGDVQTHDTAQLIDEETKDKRKIIPKLFDEIFTLTNAIKEAIQEPEIKQKISLNFDQTIESLNGLISRIAQVIYEIEKEDRELQGQIALHVSELDLLKEVTLPRLEREARTSAAELGEKTAEDAQLRTELSAIESSITSLRAQITNLKIEELKTAFHAADEACRQNETELTLTTKGNTTDPTLIQEERTLESMPFNQLEILKTKIEEVEIPALRKSIKEIEEGIKEERGREPKIALHILVKELLLLLKAEKEQIEIHLSLWLEELVKKTADVKDKRKKALDDNQARRAGLLELEVEFLRDKEDQDRKIKIFFNEIAAQIDSCNLQYTQPKVLTEASKVNISIEVPIWKESTSGESLKNFKDQIRLLKKRDALLPLIIKLQTLLNATTINYQSIEITRFYIELQQNYLYLGLMNDTRNKLNIFKTSVESYNNLLKKEEDSKQLLDKVNTQYTLKKAAKERLEKKKAELELPYRNTKKAYEAQNPEFLKLSGKVASLESQQSAFRVKLSNINPKKLELTQKKEKAEQERNATEAKRGEVSEVLHDKKQKVQKNIPRLKTLKTLKTKLDGFVSSFWNFPSLHLLKTHEEAFQKADEIATKAKTDMDTKEEQLKQGAQHLTEKENELKGIRGVKQREANTAHQDFAKSLEKFKKAEYDSARLNMFLVVIKKCDAVMKLYRHKKNDPLDSNKDLTSLRNEAQKLMQQLLQAKAELAFKKDEINSHMARLSHLTDPINTKKADEAKYKLLSIQLKRHNIDREWRVSSEIAGIEKRAAILALFGDEERMISDHFSSKMHLPSTKNRGAQEHRQRCSIQALLAFIDLFFNKIQFDLVRHPTERPKNASNICVRLKTLIETNEILKKLVARDTEGETHADRLVKALTEDVKNPNITVESSYFFAALTNIVGTLSDKASLLDHRLPILQAKFDLINYLTTKPFKKDEAYKDNESYQEARKKYRDQKYLKKCRIEHLEDQYIKSTSLHKEYEEDQKKQIEIKQAALVKKTPIIEYPVVEKVSYLAPSILLAVAYYFRVPNIILSGVSAHLSYESGMVISSVLSGLQFCLQNIFASTVLGNTKSAA